MSHRFSKNPPTHQKRQNDVLPSNMKTFAPLCYLQMFVIGFILSNEKLNKKIKDVIRIGNVGMLVGKAD